MTQPRIETENIKIIFPRQAFWVSGLNTLFVRVRVMSCPGCVLSGLCLSGLCLCPGYVRVRVMSVSGLCLCPGYVLSGLCLSGLCPVQVVSVRVPSCPGCVCPGCVVAPRKVVISQVQASVRPKNSCALKRLITCMIGKK